MADLYTAVTVSSYNANPPPDDGSQTAANEITWAGQKAKLTDPLKTAIEAIDTNIQAMVAKLLDGAGVTTDGSGVTLTASVQGKIVRQTASGITTTTPDATSVESPFVFGIINDGGGNNTVDGNGSQTINGNSTITLADQQGVLLFTDGSNWFALGLTPFASDAQAQALSATTVAITPANLAAMVATQANQETGTATDRFVTPGRQQFHASAAKAWAKADAAGNAPASYNLTSISDNGTGSVTFTWATDFSSANYCPVGTIETVSSTTVQAVSHFVDSGGVAPTVTATSMYCYRTNGSSATALDPSYWYLAAFGDQ